jgi:hypothetical protein
MICLETNSTLTNGLGGFDLSLYLLYECKVSTNE